MYSKDQHALVWFLKQGGVMTYSPSTNYHFFHILKTITDALKLLPHQEGLCVSQIVTTHDKYLVGFFKRLAKLNFPENMPKQGYFIGLATQVSNSSITLVSDKSIDIIHPIYNPHNSQDLSWVIIYYKESSPQFFKPHYAAVLPAYSQTLPLAVASDHERTMFKQLVSISLSVKEHKDVVSVQKPITKSLSINPGFTISSKVRTVKAFADKPLKSPLDNTFSYSDYASEKDFRIAIFNALTKPGNHSL
jgi:hypothetical protein